jgi:spore coat protein CotH
MEEQVEQKLKGLKERFEEGQQQLTLLEQRRMELRDSLLRIAGAIQVLEELKASESEDAAGSSGEAAPVSVVRAK